MTDPVDLAYDQWEAAELAGLPFLTTADAAYWTDVDDRDPPATTLPTALS